MFLLQDNVCHTSPSLNQGKVVKASLPLLELEYQNKIGVVGSVKKKRQGLSLRATDPCYSYKA